MSNFLEERAGEVEEMERACDGVRIIRCDELARIQRALSTATDVLTRAKSSEAGERALGELSDAACLIGGIALTNDWRPPIEFADRLETQTRVI